ncbi:MAG: hypothetical protein AAGI71_07705 [Bacteroidota bacterium]
MLHATGLCLLLLSTGVSAAIGSGLGLVYVASSLWGVRRALRAQDAERFMLFALGGMSVRLFVALALFALVLAATSVQRPAFVAAFLTLFVIGLVIEIVLVVRHQP